MDKTREKQSDGQSANREIILILGVHRGKHVYREPTKLQVACFVSTECNQTL